MPGTARTAPAVSATARTVGFDALRFVAPVGAPAGKVTREVVLSYPGRSVPLTIRASRWGEEGSAGAAVFDQKHGQVAMLSLEGISIQDPFQYLDPEAGKLTVDLYNWGSTPVNFDITPGDIKVESDQISCICVL